MKQKGTYQAENIKNKLLQMNMIRRGMQEILFKQQSDNPTHILLLFNLQIILLELQMAEQDIKHIY